VGPPATGSAMTWRAGQDGGGDDRDEARGAWRGQCARGRSARSVAARVPGTRDQNRIDLGFLSNVCKSRMGADFC
jgi:hypothetical protein